MAALSQTGPVLTSPEASERNKEPILEVLRREFAASRSVLEIGSGTGVHALHFTAHLPHLTWQPSELAENLPALTERIRREGGANLRAPLPLDVRILPWAAPAVDSVFSANTLHIMPESAVPDFFAGVGAVLTAGGVLCVYGAFNYDGRYTSDSNAEFDRWLKARDPRSGLRDFAAVDRLARAQGLQLSADHAMPFNNRTLVWRRVA
jgi:cyclopropane fatty-acyl-phospholipid synthase-like methyltransferase